MAEINFLKKSCQLFIFFSQPLSIKFAKNDFLFFQMIVYNWTMLCKKGISQLFHIKDEVFLVDV